MIKWTPFHLSLSFILWALVYPFPHSLFSQCPDLGSAVGLGESGGLASLPRVDCPKLSELVAWPLC